LRPKTGDEDFSPKDCYVVSYTAFGVLNIWSERHEQFEIDLVDLWVTSSKLAPTEFAPIPETEGLTRSTDPNILARTLVPVRDTTYDAMDELMFNRCVKMHGPLERGECYGFFPAIAMAGYNTRLRRVENIKRVSALEHFIFLAQLDTFHLVQLERGQYRQIRPIG